MTWHLYICQRGYVLKNMKTVTMRPRDQDKPERNRVKWIHFQGLLSLQFSQPRDILYFHKMESKEADIGHRTTLEYTKALTPGVFLTSVEHQQSPAYTTDGCYNKISNTDPIINHLQSQSPRCCPVRPNPWYSSFCKVLSRTASALVCMTNGI